MFIAKVT